MAPRKTLKPLSDVQPDPTEAEPAPVRTRAKKAAVAAAPAAVKAVKAPRAAKAPKPAKDQALAVPTGEPAEALAAAPEPAPAKAKATAKPGPKKAAKPTAKVTREATAEPTPSAVVEPRPAARPRKARAAAGKVEAEPVATSPAEREPASVPAERATAASGLLTDLAQAVLQAIQDGRPVELIFADAESNPPRTFEPRQLIFDTFAKGWYVWGWDRRYNAERHHLLSLLAQVNAVEGMGRAAQGPYKDGTPANQIGGWLGGEAIRVKAVLLKQWIFAVRQAPAPFPDFRIEDLEEGKAQVSFTATDLRAITRWIMQFGDGVQVLEPQRLLDRVKQVGLAWGGKPGAAAAPAAKGQPRSERAERPERSERPERPERAERPEREHREHRSEHRAESRPEPAERKQAEPRHTREPRENRAFESPKPNKAGKIEIRIDRL
jgi:predicted DNA-binding transcriptional regulator YafY